MTTQHRERLLAFRLQRPALMVGGIAMALLILSALVVHDGARHFFRAYLVGFIFIFTIAVGALGLLAIQYLSGGMWGVVIRKSLEAAARTLPFVALAFLPLLLGMHELYEWTHDEVVAADPLLKFKSRYLNEPFFMLRALAYFVIWTAFSMLMVRWGRDYEETASPWIALRIRSLSAASLVVLTLSLTFASVDWLMSLEPHWYSTMYGISFVVGCLLSALAFVSLMTTLLAEYEPLAEIFSPRTYRDLGNLMLALVMLWAYTAFSQFMLIWYGNLREEVPYYIPRMHGFWGFLAVLLILFHFFLPFSMLLMRAIKDKARTLGMVAVLILFMRMVDHYWIIMPAFRDHSAGGEHSGFSGHWMDPLGMIGLAALWLGLFLWQLEKRPLIPRNEPILEEAMSHG